LKKGRTYRELALHLGYPKWFAATLSDVIREKPGCITEERENKLRARLDMSPVRKEKRVRSLNEYNRIRDAPLERLRWAILHRKEYP